MTGTTRMLMLVSALTLTPSAAAQAQRSLTADDLAEIHNLYAHYNLMLDGGDAEAWADTFVEDGSFGNNEGRNALIAFAEGFIEENRNTRHWNTNIRISPTADGASGTAYLMLWNVHASADDRPDWNVRGHIGRHRRRLALQVAPGPDRPSGGRLSPSATTLSAPSAHT